MITSGLHSLNSLNFVSMNSSEGTHSHFILYPWIQKRRLYPWIQQKGLILILFCIHEFSRRDSFSFYFVSMNSAKGTHSHFILYPWIQKKGLILILFCIHEFILILFCIHEFRKRDSFSFYFVSMNSEKGTHSHFILYPWIQQKGLYSHFMLENYSLLYW